MSLPKQVQEAADLAEEYMDTLNPADAATEETVEEDDTSDEQEEEEEVVEEEAEEEVVEEEPVDEEEESFKQKYKSLQGKYNSQVPKLQEELKSLKEEMFGKLDAALAAKNEPAPVADTPVKNEKLDAFKEEYGEDFVENLKELFKSELDPILEERLTPVKSQVDTVEDTQIKVAQKEFKDFLNSNVTGDWEADWTKGTPEFVEFLQSPDPSGLYTYGELVKAYNDNWEAEKLTKVLNIYYGNTEEVAPEPQAKPKKQPNPDEEALVAPSRKTQHTTPSVEEKKIWTQDMIADFQKADRSGKYNAETSTEMWNDLLAALSEGRIH